MAYCFKISRIVRCEISIALNPSIRFATAVAILLLLLPVIPIQAQQFATRSATASINRTVKQIRWINNLEYARTLAAQTNQPIFIHFVQDGCPACKFVATRTFQDQQLVETIRSQFIPVKINISQADNLRQRFKIKQTPTDVILDNNHTVLYREHTVFDPRQYVGILDTLEISGIDNLAISGGTQFDPTQRPESTIDVSSGTAKMNKHFATTASYPHQVQQQTRAHSSPQVSTINGGTQLAKTQLGLDGYCCVSLSNLDGTAATWVKGNPQISIKHRDRIYLFSNTHNLQVFIRNPDKFSPVLSGFDPVLFADHRRLIDGQRKLGVSYKKRIYLFQNEHTMRTFWNSPERYANAALDAMNRTR